MKIHIFFLIISLHLSVFSQKNVIKGIVKDANTKEALAFANVYFDQNHGTTAGFNGEFSLKIPKQNSGYFVVSFIGYQTQKIQIQSSKNFYHILLKPNKETLHEVVLTAKVENPAIKILKKLIAHKKNNDYRNKLNQASYTSYFKFLVSVNRDSMNCSIDTIRYNHEGKPKVIIDSSMYNSCKEFKNKDLYIMENISQNILKSGKISHKIKALKTAGLKNPFYELLQLQFSDVNIYDDYYLFLFNKYLGPVSKLSLKQYQYKIDDTLQIQNRKVFKINYKNTKKPLIVGSIFVDAKSFAIARMTLNSYKGIELKSTQNFQYIPKYDIWFPIKNHATIKKAKGSNSILLGNRATLEFNNKSDKVSHTNPQTVDDVMYAEIIRKYSDILLNPPEVKKPLYNLQLDEKAMKQPDSLWNRYRKINSREVNTYQYMDSVFKANKADLALLKMRKLIQGYYPLSFFDLNLMKIMDFNQYEGFRLQLGGKTNEKLSRKFYLQTYAAYGFKDKDFKFFTGAFYKINHQHQIYIGLSFMHDLTKDAQFGFWNTKTGTIQIDNHFAYQYYTFTDRYQLNFKTLFGSHIQMNMNFYHAENHTKHEIPFHYGEIEFKDYDVTGIQAQLTWEPRSQFMLSDFGRQKIKDQYPKFFLKIEGNLPNFQIDNRQFLRGEIQAIFRKNYRNLDYTDLAIQAGGSILNPRLSQLYQVSFNDYGSGSFWKHINVNDLYRFETVKDLEFVNNFLVSAHLSHRINGIKISAHRKIDIRLTGAYAWGFGWDKNRYAGIQDLRYGLGETGLEFYHLLSSMGFGVYYRLGSYASPIPIENLSLRITLVPFKFFEQ